MTGLTGRFAPSPTGPLHLGSLRTALAAWLVARSAGGRFLLRVEDIDPQRSRAQFEAQQLSQLAALGIDWDGPVVRQSDRLELYGAALTELESAGAVYRCYCTRAELAQRPCPCRDHPVVRERYALRFDARGERVAFDDLLAGRQCWEVDDFLVRRSDGVFAYQLAVVVDDCAQAVTQVVRGADLLDSTGRQILLQRALGYPGVEYAHVPLVLGPDGRRLAKRYGSSGLGGTPAQTLAWLAGSLGIDAASPPQRAADLLAAFDPAAIPAEPVALGGSDA